MNWSFTFIFILLAVSCSTTGFHSHSFRKVASADSEAHCFKLVDSILQTKLERTINKVVHSSADKKIDYEKLHGFLDQKQTAPLGQHSSNEEVLAFLINLNKERPFAKATLSLNAKKQRRLIRLLEKIRSEKKPWFYGARNISREFTEILFGNQLQLKNLKANETQLLDRLVMEEITAKGLRDFVSKYHVFHYHPGALGKFVNSGYGKYVFTILMNLPILQGLPPFYLPKIGAIHLPPDIMKEMIINGRTQKSMDKLNQYFIRTYGESFSLRNRQFYNYFARTYNVAVGVFLASFVTYELSSQLAQEYKTEQQLDEVSEQINEQLEKLKEGYNPLCPQFFECLAEQFEPGAEDLSSEHFIGCRDWFDSKSQCELPAHGNESAD